MTDRWYDAEVPGPVDVSIRAVNLVMFDPLDVWLQVAQHDAAEGDRIADVSRLVVRRFRDDRWVREHR